MLDIILLAVIAGLLIYALRRAGVGGKKAQENIAGGERFLAENRQREGVQETASGLQYEVLQAGSGSEHPAATDQVLVHYHGTLLDGTVFDSSVQRQQPIAFPLNRVIAGWTEGVQLMTTGEKTRFWIPAALAYGNRQAGKIPPGSLLIFEVELLEIQR
ncbi:MAG: FKBP-type peptidyl-prolyl cis-trans isomerase [Pseudomonadota bacterium]|nr:FKBP-type peptidyl-prolyl cis-trans isomerase [Pseudomonadota bacterium]